MTPDIPGLIGITQIGVSNGVRSAPFWLSVILCIMIPVTVISAAQDASGNILLPFMPVPIRPRLLPVVPFWAVPVTIRVRLPVVSFWASVPSAVVCMAAVVLPLMTPIAAAIPVQMYWGMKRCFQMQQGLTRYFLIHSKMLMTSDVV